MRHRAVFWQDAILVTPRLGGPELRRDLGLTAGGPDLESGQILLDKRDRWRPLALTLHLNRHSEYYYRFLDGDRETFRLAFDLLGAPYYRVPAPPARRQGLVHARGRTGVPCSTIAAGCPSTRGCVRATSPPCRRPRRGRRSGSSPATAGPSCRSPTGSRSSAPAWGRSGAS